MFLRLQKNRWLGILLAFVLLALPQESLNAQSNPARYYYYQGTRVPLNVNPHLVAVRFDATLSDTARQSIADALGDLENFESGAESPIGNLTFLRVRAGRDPLAVSARLQNSAGVQFASPVYDFANVQLAETDEFLVRFAQTVSDAEIASINRAHQVSLARRLPNSNRVLILKPNAGNPRSARELANAYWEAHLVEFAEPNFVLRQTLPPPSAPRLSESAQLVPNDTNFGLQWGLKNTKQFQGSVSGADINAVNAWNVTQGSDSIKIAVIDEGVFAALSDLSGQILTGYNALNGTNNTTPKTNDHHGTGIAGVIAAKSNNGAGIAGVCWNCKILPVKVAETDAQGNWVTTTGALASGIDWAWQNGADVLNNSWTMTAPSDSVQLAIINARFSGRGGKGSTIVFASGNQNAGTVSFPASLNSYVIAVGASNWCDQRKAAVNDACNNSNGSWGSNYGSALDLVAPGEAIYTTCNGNQCTNGSYTYTAGTSLATPLVSGTAGLLYSLNPNLTPSQIQDSMQNGAKDLGTVGRDNETGYGRLDAFQSLAALFNLKLKVNHKGNFVHVGETVEFTLKYFNTGSGTIQGAQIFVPLPNNVNYAGSDPAFTLQSGNVYRLDLATLASNAKGNAKFRITILPSAAGKPITLNASITSVYPEKNTNDNSASRIVLTAQREIFLPLLRYASK